MADPSPPEKAYHGTDAQSAESICRVGLNRDAWKAIGEHYGVMDDKGFSVTMNREIAEGWAAVRAGERGTPKGVVLEADAQNLPLQRGGPGEWADPGESFVRPKDFSHVGPGVFRPVGEVDLV